MPEGGSLNSELDLGRFIRVDTTSEGEFLDDTVGQVLSVCDFIQLCRDPQVSVDDLRRALPLSVRAMLTSLEEIETPFAKDSPGILEGTDATVRENLIFVSQWSDSFHNEIEGALFTDLHESLPNLRF
mgnify:CR=1 FL=1